ncbi:MAG: helix-turn-helix transcriptional regulator [Terriglobia bacterium]|jgi:transcriptional regulator with XRE-family HTH domain
MDIAERLRQLREAKKLSQGDIERRTGLLRCYISRVENAHTVPSIETLEKISRALKVPMYQLFYDGQELPEVPLFSDNGKEDWATQRKGHILFMKLRSALSRTSARERSLLLQLATKMACANRKTRR